MALDREARNLPWSVPIDRATQSVQENIILRKPADDSLVKVAAQLISLT